MADNTTLANGDVVRDVQRGGSGGPKTPASLIDIGTTGTELLVTAGQKAMNASMPMVIASDQTPIPVSATALPLPTGAATAAAQATAATSLGTIATNTTGLALETGGSLAAIAGKDFATAANQASLATLTGPVTETAPASDTASSGLNGRLQRLAQRLTSILAALPGSLGQKASSASLAVVVASDQSAVPVSGTFFQATQPVSGTFWQATQPISGTVTANAGTGTQAVSLASLPALAAGTNTVGSVNLAASTSGGSTPYHLVSAASTNAQSIKASAGIVFSYSAFNLNASPRYLKFFDKASAPTLGADTPVLVVMIPGGTTGAGVVKTFAVGVQFSTGIAIAVVGGIADNDTTAIAASECVVNVTYK